MGLVETVSAQMKTAMKAKDKDTTKTLRSLRAAFIEAMKKDNATTLSDDVAVALVRKLAKQRAESIEAYKAGGRDDLVAAEEAELLVMNQFLPTLADEAQTKIWVDQAVAATGASSPADMGKVMGMLMKEHKDEMDGKLASRLVREALS